VFGAALFDDLQRELAGVFWGVKSVIAAGVTTLIATSALLADAPVKDSRNEKKSD